MTRKKAPYKRGATKSRKDASIEEIPEIVERNNIDRGFDIIAKYKLTDVHK